MEHDNTNQDDGEQKPLVSTGLTSAIRDDSKASRRHVLAIDWDGWEPSDRVKDLLDDLPGVTVLLESSEGSRHVWNLTMRSLDETALKLLQFKSDPMRTMLGYTWRPPRWVTRVGPKVWDIESMPDGQVYKPAPEYVAMQVNATDRPQSAKHYETLAAHIDGLPPRGEFPNVLNWHRSDVRVEKYRCLTDGQKDGGEE